jgi:hypothetical protein
LCDVNQKENSSSRSGTEGVHNLKDNPASQRVAALAGKPQFISSAIIMPHPKLNRKIY